MKQLLTKTAQAIGGTAYGFYFTAKTITPPLFVLCVMLAGISFGLIYLFKLIG